MIIISGNVLHWIAECYKEGSESGSECVEMVSCFSGVLQGSILGRPLLFIIFINDIDNGIVNKLLKFVDDAELVGIVSSPQEVEELQLDL